ncbi:RDD family protein [Bacillus sp. HMF5848]|nr:RDD family protein [Bacillus sp. HMF5848]
MTNEQTYKDDRFECAGFWIRFWAYIVDLIVIGSIQRLLVIPILRAVDIPTVSDHIFAASTVAGAFVFYGYFIIMTKVFKQTIGKMIFGLRVVQIKGESISWATAIFRECVGRFIAKTVLLIGYLMVGFMPQKQGLHDVFADTTVIHEPRSKTLVISTPVDK